MNQKQGAAGSYPRVSIKKGREYQIRRGHPWLFSGGISQAPPKVTPGSLVDLIDNQGQFVGRGYFNPATDIAVRVLTRNVEEQIDGDFLRTRIATAAALRAQSLDPAVTDAYRLINAEGDFLPGFIVDNYAGTLVVQSHTAGSDSLLDEFLNALEDVIKPQAIVLRNDSGSRKREGLQVSAPQVVRGELKDQIVIRENNLRFNVDVMGGQKTGYFTDQREKRIALQRYVRALPQGASFINAFSYTGAFAVYAASANASLRVTNIDESEKALELAKRNLELNGLLNENQNFVSMDAFTWLTEKSAAGEQNDVVLLDPPAFAKSHKDKPRALKGYVRINRLGLAATKPGGILMTCSCSGSVSLDEFSDTLRQAAADEHRDVQILEVFLNGVDHPVNAAAPEGNYLKVLICRAI